MPYTPQLARVMFTFGALTLLTSSSLQAKELPPTGSDCLAQGTRITLADGTTVPIESTNRRMQVQAGPEGHALAVLERVGGRVATQDLLVIEDDRGHELTLTAQHPVITVEHGPLPAAALEPGDLVYTQDGIARVTQVDWTSEDTRVYNLVLSDRTASLEQVDTTMYANGILIGDGRMELSMVLQSTAGASCDERPRPFQPPVFCE